VRRKKYGRSPARAARRDAPTRGIDPARVGLVTYRSLDLPWLAVVVALGGSVACIAEDAEPIEQGPAASSGDTNNRGGRGSPAAPGSSAPATAAPGGDTSAAPAAPLGPSCDEDNPLTDATTEGSTDRLLPAEIVQFERRLSWGCTHREYHETRLWDYLTTNAGYADRWAYVQKMKWTRAEVQEGEPGSGVEFLAMHRAMLGTLRDRFPAHAALFDGWSTVPTQATADDPLPLTADGKPQPAFRTSMLTALNRLENELASFPSEDELGLYIETQHRPTDAAPLARAADTTSGFHTYIHIRYDDPKSPIRMQRFSRNLESVVFFRLHGWVDRLWSEWRTGKGLVDGSDAAYKMAMHHACVHMGLRDWSIVRASCVE
jgi:hypothetical protein